MFVDVFNKRNSEFIGISNYKKKKKKTHVSIRPVTAIFLQLKYSTHSIAGISSCDCQYIDISIN